MSNAAPVKPAKKMASAAVCAAAVTKTALSPKKDAFGLETVSIAKEFVKAES